MERSEAYTNKKATAKHMRCNAKRTGEGRSRGELLLVLLEEVLGNLLEEDDVVSASCKS